MNSKNKTPTPKLFQEYYKQLNPEQKNAVDMIEGPVMVIAGPGTGKTQILTLRIANILQQTDTPPEAVLALTFTESGVVSMRKRLAEIIGSAAYRVVITTFHGFCNDIIRSYPEEFPHIIGSESITEIEQIEIMQQVIDTASIMELRPFGDRFYYLKPAIQIVNTLKQEGISPERFRVLIDAEEKTFSAIDDLYYEKGAYKGKMKGMYQDQLKHLKRNVELATLYAAYQKSLRDNKLYDYSDMIMEVVAMLERNPDLLLTLQEKYLYFLVDEHQDTNNSQNRILELIASYHDNPNLFVVGDEKQAIFRFQGASLENFHYFKNLYKGAQIIDLQHNYRSTQTILDVAASLMKRGELKAHSTYSEQKIALYEFTTPDVEQYFLAKSIADKIASGTKPEEIAILYRDNADAMPIALMLEKVGIPFAIESDQNLLRDEDIQKLLYILRAVKTFGEPGALLKMLHVDFLKIEPLDIYKVAEYSRAQRMNPYDIIKSDKELKATKVVGVKSLIDLYTKLSSWKTASTNRGAAETFETIVRDSGFLNYILSSPDAFEKIEKVRTLFDQIKGLVQAHRDYTLDQFLSYLDMLQEHEVLVKNKLITRNSGNVRLMTAHRSKGLEFEYVYLANMYDGHWGNRRRIGHFKIPKSAFALSSASLINETLDNEDERNLLYVALTRAKKEVALCYARQGYNGREQLPSQFMQEIDQNLIIEGDNQIYEKAFLKEKEILFARPAITKPGVKDKEFLNQLFQKYGLSVTALNNYLECPWRYFYVNLLRIPEAPNKHLAYGNAVHSALREFFDCWVQGEDRGSEFLIKRFKESLFHQPITQGDYDEALAKGAQALAGYYTKYCSTWSKNIRNEFKIDGIELAPDVRLNGTIDRLEILDSAGKVNVVDYKTGKPLSRNQIEGATATSDGNYKRQLVFYNLLLNRFDDGKYRLQQGIIDFIEPDTKGNFKREAFSIDSKEVNDLEEQVIAVAGEIMNLDFWEKGCKEKDCEYCKLRKLLNS